MANEEMLQHAACWHARLHAADCTEQDRIAFEQWRRGDIACDQAYALAELTSSQVSRLASADQRLRALTQQALQSPVADETDTEMHDVGVMTTALERGRAHCRSRWKVPAALAASFAMAMLALRFVPDVMNGDAGVAYESPLDGTRSITLDDGSRVQLDVNSRVVVRLTQDRRAVTLTAGRAVFDVAHDRTRPFSVTAADSRTTALGTRFQVQLESSAVVVTLAEGSVAIDNDAARDQLPATRWHEQLQPGEQLRVNTYTAERRRAVVDAMAVTSWTRGRHLFRGTPLHEALDEVNRYAHKKVRLGDPSLADMEVGGNFIAGDSELIVAAFAAVLPLSVVDGTQEIILFRRHDVQLRNL